MIVTLVMASFGVMALWVLGSALLGRYCTVEGCNNMAMKRPLLDRLGLVPRPIGTPAHPPRCPIHKWMGE